jgi:hypothetical protein
LGSTFTETLLRDIPSLRNISRWKEALRGAVVPGILLLRTAAGLARELQRIAAKCVFKTPSQFFRASQLELELEN